MVYLCYFQSTNICSFSNQTFNRSTPVSGGAVPRVEVPDQELNAVTIVRRGATVGYDNPGFQSPWSRAYTRSGPRLSALDWPDSPAMSRHTGLLKSFNNTSDFASCLK